mgnify:CR=1 FL=1
MSDTFDTVMLAVGRHAVTAGIGLEPVGVQVRYFVLVCVCARVVANHCWSVSMYPWEPGCAKRQDRGRW